MIVSTISNSYIVLKQEPANLHYPLRGTSPKYKAYDRRGMPLTAVGVGCVHVKKNAILIFQGVKQSKF